MDIRFAKNNFELFPTITNFNKLMNKQQLIESVAKKTGQTKSSTEASLNGIIDSVKAELKKGGTVQLIGFGTFGVSARKARAGKNPRTGEAIKISARKVPTFKAGKRFERYC